MVRAAARSEREAQRMVSTCRELLESSCFDFPALGIGLLESPPSVAAGQISAPEPTKSEPSPPVIGEVGGIRGGAKGASVSGDGGADCEGSTDVGSGSTSKRRGRETGRKYLRRLRANLTLPRVSL